MEVQVTCFHESRHTMQWKCINCEIKTETDPITLQKWKHEMNNYNQPTKKDFPEEEYIKQEIEIDAILYAHMMMKEHFNVTTLLPDILKNRLSK